MNKKTEHLIIDVLEGSIGEEMEIAKGDILLSVNGTEIEDILDYQFQMDDEEVNVLIRKPDGEEWELEIEKNYGEDIGLVFENGLMDEYRSCSNKCIFCFIDQMPPGMRETLYFKDDDARLSFLQGNYITLTNMKQKDLDKIVRYHLNPINISVHTTNPELRKTMLHNKFAGNLLEKIDYLYDNDIEMNGQIVLCKGYNDGEELKRTLNDLIKYCPIMKSVSIVPVGLTKFREGLTKLELFNSEDAGKVIDEVEAFQKICMDRYGIHFVHASDEFYILAGRKLPETERYDGYIQLENGVGMLRLLLNETREAVDSVQGDDRYADITIATGKLSYPFVVKCADMINEKFKNIKVNVIPVINHFFGEDITVSGLITGKDLSEQLKTVNVGEKLLIPINMLRYQTEVFLDDMTVSDIQKALQVPVVSVKSSGYDLVEQITGICVEGKSKDIRPYEL